jgi:hypothetical protein
MDSKLETALQSLKELGWIVELRAEFAPLPSHITMRYPWVTDELETALGWMQLVQRPDEQVWLLASTDYDETSGSAFAWNEMELQSLEAAKGDVSWCSEIKQFWDGCMPIALSVAAEYAYYAVRPDGMVVHGREPEYEDARVFSSTFPEFLQRVAINIV